MNKNEKDLKDSDLFSNVLGEDTTQSKEVKAESEIPHHYIPIQFDSLGKLSAPTLLHFRNFSPNEVAKLAVAESDAEYSTFINCFNSMVWEDFDCNNLHIKELLQILYTLHGSFFSNTIEKKYLIDTDLEDPERNESSNIDTATIEIADLVTKTLPKNFKEPIRIKSRTTGVEVSFRLPRAGFTVITEKFLADKYKKELQDFYDIKSKIAETKSIKDSKKREDKFYAISTEQRQAYEKFQRIYWEEYTIILNALCILEVDGKKASSIEEHIELGGLIDNSIQSVFNKVQEDYDFGIQEEVEYFSQRQKKKLSRRFRFRVSDFISSSVESETDTRFDIQFG
ncbi:MAG: hypothetical protein PF569_01685 [Candidatus Woesearchaeota archaeon]|jgi:hypothetical protein|nr:hypothetical protein [Candidatus Woesearchaeota archaeon]